MALRFSYPVSTEMAKNMQVAFTTLPINNNNYISDAYISKR